MIDILIVLFFAGMIVIGYRQGFIWQVLKLCRLLFLLIIFYFFGHQITEILSPLIKPFIESVILQNMTDSFKEQASSFLIRLFFPFLLILIMSIITKQILRLFHGKIIKNIPIVGMLNAIMGSAVAIVQSLCLFFLIVGLLPLVGSEWNVYVTNNSLIVRFVQEQIPYLLSFFQMYWS